MCGCVGKSDIAGQEEEGRETGATGENSEKRGRETHTKRGKRDRQTDQAVSDCIQDSRPITHVRCRFHAR